MEVVDFGRFFFTVMIDKAGVLPTTLFILYWLERNDRKEAWRMFNKFLVETNSVLTNINHAIDKLTREVSDLEVE